MKKEDDIASRDKTEGREKLSHIDGLVLNSQQFSVGPKNEPPCYCCLCPELQVRC